MMSLASEINWNDMVEAIPAFLTLFMIPFTFSITNGILCGLAAAFLLYLMTGQCLLDMLGYFGRKHPENASEEFGLDELEAPLPTRSRNTSFSSVAGLSLHGWDHANDDEMEFNNSVFAEPNR